MASFNNTQFATNYLLHLVASVWKILLATTGPSFGLLSFPVDPKKQGAMLFTVSRINELTLSHEIIPRYNEIM